MPNRKRTNDLSPISRLANVRLGLKDLRRALSSFKFADAPQTVAKIRRALDSAEGAERHAYGRTLRDERADPGPTEIRQRREPLDRVRQTACRFCELDIENIRNDRGRFPAGQWRDRGNNTTCNDGKHKHAPVKD